MVEAGEVKRPPQTCRGSPRNAVFSIQLILIRFCYESSQQNDVRKNRLYQKLLVAILGVIILYET